MLPLLFVVVFVHFYSDFILTSGQGWLRHQWGGLKRDYWLVFLAPERLKIVIMTKAGGNWLCCNKKKITNLIVILDTNLY